MYKVYMWAVKRGPPCYPQDSRFPGGDEVRRGELGLLLGTQPLQPLKGEPSATSKGTGCMRRGSPSRAEASGDSEPHPRGLGLPQSDHLQHLLGLAPSHVLPPQRGAPSPGGLGPTPSGGPAHSAAKGGPKTPGRRQEAVAA